MSYPTRKVENLLKNKYATAVEWEEATKEFYVYRGKFEEKIDLINSLQHKIDSLQEKIGEKESEKKQTTKEYHQSWSVVTVRSKLEDLSTEISALFAFPDKPEMLKRLKAHSSYISGNHSKYHFTYIASIHYVRWYYYLTFCYVGLAVEIKRILRERNVEIEQFCVLIGLIYMKTSSKMHCPSIGKLSTEEIKIGLFNTGLQEQRLLDAVDILLEIQKIPLSSLSQTTSSNQSTSKKTTSSSQAVTNINSDSSASICSSSTTGSLNSMANIPSLSSASCSGSSSGGIRSSNLPSQVRQPQAYAPVQKVQNRNRSQHYRPRNQQQQTHVPWYPRPRYSPYPTPRARYPHAQSRHYRRNSRYP